MVKFYIINGCRKYLLVNLPACPKPELETRCKYEKPGENRRKRPGVRILFVFTDFSS